MGHHAEAYVGIDTSKSCNAIAIADGSRGGEVRYPGDFPATEAATRKLLAKLAAKYRDLTFCYGVAAVTHDVGKSVVSDNKISVSRKKTF